MNPASRFFQIAADAALPALVDSALKGSVLLCLTGVIALLARHTSAAVRHLIWCLGIVGCLVLPLLSVGLPEWRVPIGPRPQQQILTRCVVLAGSGSDGPISAPVDPPAVLPEGGSSLTGGQPAHAMKLTHGWIFGVWLAVASCLTLQLIASQWWLGRCSDRASLVEADRVLGALKQAAERFGFRPRVRVLVDRRRLIPLAWGAFRPNFLLPAEALNWDAPRLEAVFLHELAHVKRYDLALLLLARVACALYWFSPLVWIAAWRLRVECERASDDMVLRSGMKPSEYAGQLLQISSALQTHHVLGVLAMARPTRLEHRLRSVLDSKVKRAGVTPRLLISASAVALICVIPLSVLRGARAAELKRPEKTVKSSPGMAEQVPATNASSATNSVVSMGIGRVIPEQLVQVNARVPGYIVRIGAEAGATVKMGDILAELDPAQYQLQLERLRAKLAAAQARLEQAKRLDAEHVAIAQAELDLAKVDLIAGEHDLANTRIGAPIDGVVLRKKAELGMLVDPKAASQAAPLYEMADLRHLAVQVEVPVSITISQGQHCLIYAGDRTTPPICTGEVEGIGMAADPNTGTFPVRVRIGVPAKEHQLRPGAIVSVGFLADAPGK